MYHFSALYTPKIKNSISNEYEEKTENFEYDLIGNPTLYKGISLASSWTKCRQLTSFNGTTFSYNGQGQRISKKKGTEPVITFTYDSSGNLIKQSNGIEYLYDNSGECGIIYNSVPYFYRKYDTNIFHARRTPPTPTTPRPPQSFDIKPN